MVLHLCVLLHVSLQHLRTINNIPKLDVLSLPIASREHPQLRLEVPHDAAVDLHVVPEDVCEAAQILWRHEGILIGGGLGAGRLVGPQQPVDPDLHDLLRLPGVVHLSAEVAQLAEVVVERMLPRHLAGVRADVADDAADALVASPWLGQLGLLEGLDEPLHLGVEGVHPQVRRPLLERRNAGLAPQGWKALQLHQGLLRHLVVDAEKDEGVGVEVLEALRAEQVLVLELCEDPRPEIVQVGAPPVPVAGREDLPLELPRYPVGGAREEALLAQAALAGL
mmetsp:Transcript_104634/g.293226  ORF Transcript_104634/g.293226 Transcript_104634/m.293226 type:complete len:280 (-) Transcript_104634:316-1155(-)